MRKKPLLTAFQIVLMTVGSALVIPYTFMPILATPPKNQDVWITLLLSIVYIIIINAPILFIINKFRGCSASQTLGIIMGKPLGKIAALIYVLFLLYCSTACMMIMGHFLKTYLEPETPFLAIALSLAIPLSYMSYKGAGAIGRTAPFFVSFLILTILFFFIFSFEKMDINQIKPVLADSTFGQLNQGAFLTAARYSEILIFFVFSFYISKKVSILKTYSVALGIFAVCFVLILLPTILVLGGEYARHLWSPYFVFASQVEAFGFLTRVQILFVTALIPVSIIKLTMYNYMASHVAANVVGAKTHKYFVMPFALISLLVCMIPFMQKSGTIAFLGSDEFFPYVIIPVVFILPLLMLFIYFIRHKKINIMLLMQKSQQQDQPAENGGQYEEKSRRPKYFRRRRAVRDGKS